MMLNAITSVNPSADATQAANESMFQERLQEKLVRLCSYSGPRPFHSCAMCLKVLQWSTFRQNEQYSIGVYPCSVSCTRHCEYLRSDGAK